VKRSIQFLQANYTAKGLRSPKVCLEANQLANPQNIQNVKE
jgi:hypothetical protein